MAGIDLILCRTPLQAVIVQAVMARIGVTVFDVVYLTCHDTCKDRHYFSELSRLARYSEYINISRRSKEALHHRLLFSCLPLSFKTTKYRRVLLASYNLYLFRLLVKNSQGTQIITFDDGTANIMNSSSYYNANTSRGTYLYEWLFGIDSRDQFKKRISKHYSIYRDFSNIVESDRLDFVDIFSKIQDFKMDGQQGSVSFFIGQPFDEVVSAGYFDHSGLTKLVGWFGDVKIHYYLQHPRETQPIPVGGRLVKDANKIAEETIFELASGQRPHIYSWFSTVLFNVGNKHADKTYLSIGDTPAENERIRMTQQVGCNVVRIDTR